MSPEKTLRYWLRIEEEAEKEEKGEGCRIRYEFFAEAMLDVEWTAAAYNAMAAAAKAGCHSE